MIKKQTTSKSCTNRLKIGLRIVYLYDSRMKKKEEKNDVGMCIVDSSERTYETDDIHKNSWTRLYPFVHDECEKETHTKRFYFSAIHF